MPPRPTTVHGFAEMDVMSPADVLRRHLDVFHSTGNLPSIKPRRRAVTPGADVAPMRSPYRAADMVKVGIDRAHRLTPSKSSPSKRHISSIMVLYTHDSRFLKNPVAQKKVTTADLEPLAERSGFQPRELLRFIKPFQKLSNPTTKGLDAGAFTEFMQKFINIDPADEFLCQRLFDVTNTRGAFYVVFEQCVDTLRIFKKGDTMAKGELFFSMVDLNNNGFINMQEMENLVQTKPPGDGHMDLMKEKRKIHMTKVGASIFRLLDKNLDSRVSKEEFLNAISVSAEVRRFFGRTGFL